MDLMNLIKEQGKSKKKTLLIVEIECESQRQATNLKACVNELLTEDLNKTRKDIKYKMRRL